DEHQDFHEYLHWRSWSVVDETGRGIPFEELPHMRALRTGKPTDDMVLGLYHRPERRLRWLSVSTVPLFAPGSRTPHQVLLLFSDITELKRDSALFDRAQALAHIGGWEWEVDRDALYLTGEGLRILGQAGPPRCIGEMRRAGLDEAGRRFDRALRRTVAGHGPLDVEVQGRRADGQVFWVRIIGEARTGQSEGTSITGTLQDITERKQEQETLRVR